MSVKIHTCNVSTRSHHILEILVKLNAYRFVSDMHARHEQNSLITVIQSMCLHGRGKAN